VPGPFQGVGPRGYQRSDDRVREDICELLSAHGQLDASDIDVEVAQGEVQLRGTVDSRWAKREAENLIDAVPGVRDIHNGLRIREQRTGTNGQAGGQSAGSTQ
jgi:osmotically-inducible protein OsmY